MKSMLKLFCIALISAGFVLSGCERQQETTEEDATAQAADEQEDTGQAAEEQDTGAAEEEQQADTGAQQQADAQEDTGQQGPAAKGQQQQQQQQAARPQQPPFTGAVTGNVGGSGITNGQLKLNVNKDYAASGSFTGQREDVRFVIPLEGKVSKNNSISLTGSRDGNNARVNGSVTKSGVNGTISGTIHQKNFESRFNVTK